MSLVTANNLINTWNLNGGSLDAAFVSTIQGSFADINYLYNLPNLTGLGDEAHTLEDTSLAVVSLNTLDGKTSGTINASSINTLTGSSADLITAYASGGISNLGNEAVIISDTSLAVSVLNTLDGRTSGAINANSITTLSGTGADLNTAYTSGGISNLGNEAVTLTDTSLAASVLNALDGRTSGTINANSINTLTGSAADLITAYDSGGITGLGNEAVNVNSGTASTSQANVLAADTSGVVTATISDGDMATLAGLTETGNAYSITITDNSVAAAALNTLDGKTSVAINASNITTVSGSAADLITAYDSGGISGLGNEAINVNSGTASTSQANALAADTSGVVTATLSDGDIATLAGLSETGNAYTITITDNSVAATALNTLDGKTTVAINASNITTLTGAAADLNTAYTANGNGSISGLNNEAITLSDTSLAVSVLNTLDGHTSGTINANSINTLSGAAADLNTAYASAGISGLANEAISLSDTTLAASVLNTLDGHTSGSINASSINTLSGNAANLITAYASGEITGLGNEAVNVNSGTASTAQANNLAAATSGVVTATLADGDMATLAGLSETGNAYTITITDNSVAAAALNTLDGKTSVAINASNINTLTGAAADLNTAYTANGSSITGLGNEAATLSDTSLAVAVLNTLDGNTSGAIDASNINTLTGNAANLITAYDSGGITGLGNEAVNVNSGSASTSQANALAADTSGVVTATISDGDMATLAGLSETGNAYTITITDNGVAAAALNTLDGKTSVAINASNITTLTGAAADLNSAYASSGISNLGNEAVTLSDTSLAASVLNILDGHTSGTINASSINTLTGSAADLNTAYTSGGISNLGNEAVTLSDTSIAVSVLNTLDGRTSGAINASSINTLTGSAADLNTAYTSGGISNLGNEAVTLSDTSLAVSVLNILDGRTSGAINASSINSLSGSAADLITAYDSGGITGLGNETVNVNSGSASTAQANSLAADTSGVVTANISDGDMATLASLTETGNAYAITITDNSVAAAALNTLDGKTSVAINASNITTLSGSYADLNTAFTANSNGSISGLGNEAINVNSGTTSTAQANNLAASTSGVVTATLSDGDMATLAGITETGNAYTITVSDASVAASALNSLDGKTSVAINASNVTTLSGSYADLNTAFTANSNGSISGLGNEAISVSGAVTTSQANTLAAATSGVVTATVSDGDMATLAGLSETGNAYTITITDNSVAAAALNTLDGKTSVAINANNITTLSGAAADLNTAYASSGLSGLNNEAITLTDSSLAASVLNTLDGNTSGSINANSINTITGTAADLITAYASGGINGLGNEAVNVNSGSASTSQANALAADTSGVVTATLSDGDMATLAGLSETGNAYTITITDTSVAASALNTLDGKTTVAINASNITTFTGAAADLNTAYTSGGINNLGDEAITLSDTSLAVSVLNALDGHTSGAINASSINTLTGAAADLNTAYTSGGINNLGNEAITLSDTSLAVSVLNSLDGHTSGAINASSINTLTGAAADLNTAYTSGGINNLGNEAATLADTSLAVSVLNILDGHTSGTINASSINTLTGAAADLNTAYTSGGISNLGNEAVTLSDTSLAVSVLNALDGRTSGAINASSINTLTGAAADFNTAYASGGISNLGDEAITLSDTSLAASVLNTLDGHTSGAINASSINTLTGAAVDLNTAYGSSGINNLGNEAVTLNDTSLAVSVLNILDGHTSGTINASSINTLTGTAADLNTAYGSSGINNLGNEAITLADTSLAVSVLNILDGHTSGTINASSINTLSGAAADLNTAYGSSGINNLGNEAITLSDTSLAVSVLNSLDGHTSGAINASSINTLTGAAADLNTAYGSSGINNLGDEAITLSDTSLAVSVINILDGHTSGTINASSINTLTGAAADLNTAYTSAGISGLNNEAVTLNDTTLAVSVLNILDGHTSGTINASSINALAGSYADLNTAFTANSNGSISGLGNEAVSISEAVSTSQANNLAAATSGVVTATLSDGDLATLAGLTETGNAYSITISDASVAVSALNTLDGKTTVAINASNITTLTGAAADLNTAYTSSGISNLGNEAVTLNDTSLNASVLNALDGRTSGAINASSINTLSGSAADLISAYDSGGINGLGNEAVNVNSGTASTSQANALAADTSAVVTATISDGDMATLAGLSETGNAYSITITDNSVAAAALNALDGKTSVAINASNITTLTGAAADLNTAYTANGNGSINGLGNEAATLSDTTLAVSVLNDLDGNTSGTINANSINTLSGSAADLITAYDSGGISGLGNEAVNVNSGTASTSQANALAADTSAVVTATLSDGDMSTLAGLTETGNAYTITITDNSVAAAALNTLDSKTTVAINASHITTLTGAAADLNTAYTANGNGSITGLGNEAATLSDTSLAVSVLNTLDSNTTGAINASSINTLTGTAADLNTAYASSGISGLANEAITLSDSTLNASVLNDLDGNTSGAINAGSINTLTGTAADLITTFTANSNGSISGLGNEAVNVNSGSASTSQANALAAATSGVVTATISDGDMATLAGLTETGNAYSITITDTSVAASPLNTLDGKTTVAINASNITTLTGAAADLNTAYTANGNGSITGLGNEAATLSDTTLAVSVLNDLDGNTSGAIDASSINTLTSDDYDSLNTAYTAAGSGAITGLGNEAITVNNRIRASEANTLNGHTSGVVTATVTDSNGTSALLVSNALTLNGTGNAYSIFIRDRTVATTDLLSIDALTTVTINAARITRLTGTYASIISTYAAETAGTISGLGSNCSFTASGSITVAEANTLSGLISHGSRSLTATISNGDMATLAGISESGHNLSITITDTSVAAAALNTLDGKTDTTINASNITTLTGAAADLNTAYASSGISGLNNEAVTLSDTSLSASVLNTLDSNTSGTINASSIDTLSGAAADLNTAYTSAGISGLSDEAITLTDTSLAASILNALDGHTSGTINAGSINTLSGNAADLITAYASSGISGLNDEAISVSSGTVTTAQANTLSAATSAVVTATISDGDMATLAGLSETGNAYTITITDTSVAASALNTLNGKTTVSINASNITTLTGAAADLNTAYTANGNGSISGLGNEAATLSDTSLAVSVLNILDGRTSGSIDAGTINTLTGTAADLNTAYTSGGISNLGNEAVTLSDTALAVSVLNDLDGNTSGTINASNITTLSGAAADLNTAYTANANGSISGLNNEAVTLSDTSLAVSVLNDLDGNTSGTINASSINTLTGTASALINAYDSGGISGLGNEAVNVNSGTASTSQANALAADTSAVVTTTISDGDMATLAGLTETGNAYSITITDNSVAAAALNALDGKTSVAINASNITTLSGSAADLISAYDSGGINGLGNEAVNVNSGTASTSQANALAADTSAVVTATISDGDMATLAGLTETGNAYTITVTDNNVAAAALNTLDGKTSVAINASNITTLSGNAADLITTFTANSNGSISGLGNEAVNVNSGTASTSQANALAAATSGVVTATISDGDMATLAGITETGNAYTITVTDNSVAAAALNTLDGKTSVAINSSNITTLTGAAADLNTAYTANGNGSISGLGNEAATLSDTTLAVSVLNDLDGNTSGTVNANTINTLTGSAADLNTAYTSGGISNLGNEAVTLSDSSLAVSVLNILDGRTSGTINASSINTLTGAAADLNTAYTSAGISGLNNEAITLSDTTLAVSVLNDLDGRTSGAINASSINTLSGSAADLISAYDSGGINGLGNEAVNVNSGTASTSQANALAADTSAVVTATISDGDMATLAGLSETGNAYSITITDNSVAAAALNALDGKTSVAINANAITTLSGSAADLISAYTANSNGSINGLGNEAVNVNSGSASTSQANALAAATSAVVTATISDGDMATLAGITETGNAYTITITDTSVAASALNTLDGKTSVAINASNITTLTGAAADLNTAYTANGNGSISGLGNEAATLSDSSLAVSVLNDLNSNTSGTINAGSINSLSGTAADLITAYAANGSGISGLGNETVNVSSGSASTSQANNLAAATSAVVTATISDGDMATLAGLTETSNAYTITITDNSVAASALNTLDGKTSVAINASNINTLTGAAADLNTAYTANGNGSITGLGNEAATLSDTSLAVSVLNDLNSNTSGTINAGNITTLTGTAADLNTAYAANGSGISGLNNEAVTLTDSSLAVSVLNILDGNTSGTINAGSINTLTGTAADLNTAYTASGISGLSNEAVTLSDTTLAVSVLNDLDGRTSGTINAGSVNTLTGSAADLNTAYTSAGISGLNNEAVTLNDTTLAVSVLNDLDGRTSGAINASSINTLSGSAADLISAYDSGGINGLGNEAVNVNSGTASTSQANALAADTSAVVTATISDGDMATLAGLTETGNAYTITVTDNNVAAAALNTLDGKTSVAINASNITTLTGAAADLNTAYTANANGSISGLNNEAVTLSDTSLAVSVLNDLDGNTSGTINASSINTLTGTASALINAYDSGGISGLANEAVTLTDTTLAVSVLNALDGRTSGTINANSINTLTGAATDLITAFASGGINNLGATAVNVNSGSASTSQANDLAAATSGVVTATISDGDMDTLAGLTETGNAYTITITDNSVAAAALNTLDGKTTVAINASNITTLTGAAADLNTAYTGNGNGSISGLGNEAATLSDTSLAVSVLNDLDGNTSGAINANSINTLTGSAADLNTAYTSGGISNLGNEAVTLTDSSLAVSVLNALDGRTTGSINANSINTLSGTAADLISTYAANGSGISGLGNEAVNVNSGSASTSQANSLAADTSGVVTATISEGDMATLAGLTETSNAYAVTITDTRVNADELNTLNSKTTVNIDCGNITQIVGAISDIATAYTSGGFSGLGDEEIIFTFANIQADLLNAIDAANSRVINASGVASLTGSASDLNTAYASSGVSGLGNEPVTLTDTSLAASVLNTLDGNTSGTIDASSINTLTGTATDINTAYASNAAGGISNLGNEAVTLSDTSLAASVLNTLDGRTSGTINASSINTLSGTASDLNISYTSAGISGLNNEAITLTDTSLTASVLNTLDGRTSGTINANSINTLAGTAADLNTAYTSSGISGLNNEAVTLTDTSLTASVLNTLDGNTSGTVNANSINTLTGTAADLNTAYASSGISNLGDEAVTITDTSLAVSVLNTLDGNTSGSVNASSVNTLSGTAADLKTAYDSSGISGLGNEAVTITDTSLAGSVSFTQLGPDIDGEAANDYSGRSVSLSSDGSIVAIGAYANDGNGSNSGHTRIYQWDSASSSWNQRGSDIDGEAAGDYSGFSVSLSSDGSTVAIGAFNNDGNGYNSGHTRIYKWDGSSWNQRGSDIDGEAAYDYSGRSVSLSSDGSTVAIGAYYNDGNGYNSGHTRIYKWDGSSWNQRGSDIDGEAANDYSGRRVSLSSDGSIVAIGAYAND
ncbi:hypothetical protein, partial [Synechococcus sp. UW179A]|uniref:hypothetical protein n=1 Tax=Synechococcus sp. UW179A TaxID=2575510 RepID=UPI0010BF36D9